MNRYTNLDTALGGLTVVVTDDTPTGAPAVCGIYFPGHWTKPDRTRFGTPAAAGEQIFDTVRRQLGEYVAGARREFDIALKLSGPPLHRRVWALLQRVGYGETTTYGALAARLGVANAQPIGQAVGHNPISIIVPCHRVVGSDGRLTGYAGGVDRKAYLLDLESSHQPGLFGADPPAFGQR